MALLLLTGAPSPDPCSTSSAHFGGGVCHGGSVFAVTLESLNLSDIEVQVRQILHQVCRGDVLAVARWYSLDSEAGSGPPRKADIQYVVARELGFKSWQSLRERLNKT